MLTPDALDKQRRAGRLARKALRYGETLITPGASMREVLDKIESFIREQGGEPAFPAQSCVNEMAAHYCPTDADDYTYKQGDLVKLDVGVHVDGYIGDNALTISLGSDHEDLSRAVKEALENALAIVKPGVTLHEIGTTVQATLAKHGFQPIRNLTGHGLGQYLQHCPPSIPNFPTGEKQTLKEGMVVAIEPFGTTGSAGLIVNGPGATLFSLGEERPVRSPHARDVMALIKTYKGLPFTTRWVTRELGSKGTLGLAEIRRAGLLHEYAPLPEKSKGVVAQWEHTILVTKDGCEILTAD